ncbi:HupE/UreJ family protein [Sphingorhabdus sp. IMCC26285]|uniref:HupE/UreJ family protein n=1 Tax=Sphingorhabdus profundilacus TaxID=2509718 RepID=A0A6I4M357_9SPHN|nr:HupE/UreJ family protein [Sphingorhabdus profundilacus]MVZ98764.1 HupE/UreJ family protein [Sphingorhabdus profundilacus]
MTRLLWLLILLAVQAPVHADELRPGYVEFEQKSANEWIIVWKIPLQGGFTPLTRPQLPAGCQMTGIAARQLSDAAVTTRSAVHCRGDVSGQFIGLENFETAQSDVLVRVAPLARPVQAMRLTPAEPRTIIQARAGTWQVAQTYFLTGIDHILFGYDHLLFVVALVLLLQGFWTIAKAVTAFTLAHSLTLAGTTLGWIGLPQNPVESVIALSIMFLAVEIIKRKPDQKRLSERAPWIVAFGFGLLHGFGFAGALKEIGLPEQDVSIALVTFNLGVEAGQIVIIAATLMLLETIRRLFATALVPVITMATYAIGITASFWFIERTFS